MKIPVTIVQRFNKRIPPDALKTSWPWALLGISLFILLNMYRLREALSQAGLRVEDISYFNTNYAHAAPFRKILQENGGEPYIIPWTNLFAWLIASFDIRVQPYLYQWTGFFWATMAVAVPFFSGMIRSKPVAILGPLLLGLIGLNHAFYSLTLIYTMYTGVLVVLCILFFDTPKTRSGTIFFALSMSLLPWFGPYSVLIIPVGILFLVLFREDKKKQLLLLTALCSTGLYYLVGVEGGTSNILQLKQLWIIKTYLHFLLEDIVLLGLIGKVSLYFWFPIILLLTAVMYIIRHDLQYIKYSLALFVLICISLLLIFASNRYPLILYVRPCHKMISLFFWMVFLLFSLDRLFMVIGVSKIGIVVFMICSVSLVIFDSTKHSEKWVVRPVQQQKEFLEAIHYYEGLNLKERNQYIVFKLKTIPDSCWQLKVKVGSRMSGKQLIGKKAFRYPQVGREFIE